MAAAASRIVQTALRHVAARSDLLDSDRTLVVAVSGGQDSTCLLHAVAVLARERGFRVLAAHVDHRLRAESAADAARVAELARSLRVPIVVRSVGVAAYRAAQRRVSLQQAARAARYQALAVVVAEHEADALLAAHTADDQAETVLLNLLRGAGLSGLAGMRSEEWIDPTRLGPPVAELAVWGINLPRQVRLARPLLKVERSTTRAYCEELGLPIVEDRSNYSRAYTRNRVRLDVLPALEKVRPGLRAVLARTADLVAEDLAALEATVRALHDELARPAGRRGLAYDLARWRAQPRGYQRRLLRRGIESLTGGLADVPAAPVEDVLDLLQAASRGATYHLPRGLEVVLLEGSFVLRQRDG